MAHQRELCADLRKRITRTIVPMEYRSQNRMSICPFGTIPAFKR